MLMQELVDWLERHRALYLAVHVMMARLRCDGAIDSQADTVVKVINALYEIDTAEHRAPT